MKESICDFNSSWACANSRVTANDCESLCVLWHRAILAINLNLEHSLAFLRIEHIWIKWPLITHLCASQFITKVVSLGLFSVNYEVSLLARSLTFV